MLQRNSLVGLTPYLTFEQFNAVLYVPFRFSTEIKLFFPIQTGLRIGQSHGVLGQSHQIHALGRFWFIRRIAVSNNSLVDCWPGHAPLGDLKSCLLFLSFFGCFYYLLEKLRLVEIVKKFNMFSYSLQGFLNFRNEFYIKIFVYELLIFK